MFLQRIYLQKMSWYLLKEEDNMLEAAMSKVKPDTCQALLEYLTGDSGK